MEDLEPLDSLRDRAQSYLENNEPAGERGPLDRFVEGILRHAVEDSSVLVHIMPRPGLAELMFQKTRTGESDLVSLTDKRPRVVCRMSKRLYVQVVAALKAAARLDILETSKLQEGAVREECGLEPGKWNLTARFQPMAAGEYVTVAVEPR